jgi:hypothetical protein
MTDIRHEIELMTPGLNSLEGQGECARSVVERAKKTLLLAADEIERLRAVLRTIADVWDPLDAAGIARAALSPPVQKDKP